MKSALQLKLNKSGEYVLKFHKLVAPVLEYSLLQFHGSQPKAQSITRSVYPDRKEDQQLLDAQCLEWHEESKKFIEYILPGIKQNNLNLTREELEEFIRTLNLVRIQIAQEAQVNKEHMEKLPSHKIQVISEINLLGLVMETILLKIN
jgi:hypothetical protein